MGVGAMRLLALGVISLSAAVSGCSTLPRLEAPPPHVGAAAAPLGFSSDVRFSAFDVSGMRRHFNEKQGGKCNSVLALSGGGSGGAFGAGGLVGWTRAGSRPQFDIVTGVSAGALAAAFAFAGSEWDSQLKSAFTGGWSKDLLRPAGVATLFGTSVFQGHPLREIIERFITPELLSAVAAESRKGRILLVATTDLDDEETIVWDMGAIAESGGARGLSLFRDVLAASASVSGVFPPVMIRVEDRGKTYEEMHVDGGVTTPFFVAPFVDVNAQSDGAPGLCQNIYVIVNGTLGGSAKSTERNTIEIAGRSIRVLMDQTVRSELLRIDAIAHLHGANLRYGAVPRRYGFSGSVDFSPDSMSGLFALGESCAAAGRFWIGPGAALPSTPRNTAGSAPKAPLCPASSDDLRVPSP
jgi:predicted acylesterase/phospholipase RssA